MTEIIIHDLKVGVGTHDPEAAAIDRAVGLLKKIHISASGDSLCVVKKSVDARKRDAVCYVFSVAAKLEYLPEKRLLDRIGAIEQKNGSVDPEYGTERLENRPVVVGLGPCGMFCALLLAENGYRPIVIERGANVSDRKAAVERFYKERILDPDCNIQFGAGGAGTFSDGKLMTRINDPKCAFVLKRFVGFGAPSDITVQARPHIGTDLLLDVVNNIVKRIEECGGSVCFNTRLESVECKADGSVCGIKTNRGDIDCDILVMAIGHSSRDTYDMLIDNGFAVRAKSFSVGVRIEHPQEMINRALYGSYADLLPPAEYSLSKRVGERGVYSFCMCPGGEVVAATSEIGGVVTNGMSRHARDGKNANSALAVSVFPDDYDGSARGAIEFCRAIERRAFELGGCIYNAPVQTVGDFLSGRFGSLPSSVEPTYMGGGHFELSDLHRLFPKRICSMLELGIADFAGKIAGFDMPEAMLTGPETRTSAPIRILRGDNMTATGHPGIYPCGEGAGYAGGITSAAVDGVNCALSIMKEFAAK